MSNNSLDWNNCGLRPETDWPVVFEVQVLAAEGQRWRKANDGKWRQP